MSAISSVASTSGLLPSRFGELTSEDFVKLIFTELRHQDPFKPNDSSELLKQIDSIRSIQTNMDLGERLSQIADSSRLWGAGDLIGRFVKGLTSDYLPVQGTVVSVHQTAMGPMLELESGQFVPLALVQSILASGAGDASASGSSGGAGGETGGASGGGDVGGSRGGAEGGEGGDPGGAEGGDGSGDAGGDPRGGDPDPNG